MEANSVRKFQPFATSMIRFRHEIKRQIDNAYIICHESNPKNSCIEDCCPFFEGDNIDGCQLHHLLNLFEEL